MRLHNARNEARDDDLTHLLSLISNLSQSSSKVESAGSIASLAIGSFLFGPITERIRENITLIAINLWSTKLGSHLGSLTADRLRWPKGFCLTSYKSLIVNNQ